MTLDEEVAGLLEILRGDHGPVCAWCKSRRHPVKSKGLCGHCNRIRLKFAALEKRAEENGRTSELDYAIRVETAKMERCKLEGRLHTRVAETLASGLDIEHDISYLSKLILGEEMFYGYANWFGHAFTPDQRILLHYFLDELGREYTRQNRLTFAMDDVLDKTIGGDQ